MSFVQTTQQKVTLTTPNERVDLTCIKGFGAFNVLVEDADFPGSGACAVFSIAANVNQARVQSTAAVMGSDGETLQIYWVSGQRPQLAFTGKVNPEFLPKKYLVACTLLSVDPTVRT